MTGNQQHGHVAARSVRILSMKEICDLTGYSRTHIYRLERSGKFIRRRKLGPSKIGFLLAEFEEWVSKLPLPDLPRDEGDLN